MRFKFAMIALLCAGYFAAPFTTARASEIIFVSPTRVNLSEANKVMVMNVTNVSDVERTYKVGIQDVVMTEKGVTQSIDDFPYSAKKMLRFFPRQFTVPAGQKQAIRIMAKIPADLPDGQYHSHIHFFEDAEKQGKPNGTAGTNKATMSAPLSYSALLPITVTKGKVETKVGWVDPKILPSQKPNTKIVSMQLTREGNGQGTAFVDVFSGAQQISKRRTAYIYREIDKRDYSFDFPLPEGGIPSGNVTVRLLSGDPKNPVPVQEVSLPIP